jgi:diguanylate cyclase (GGDEF)-like protein
VAVAVIAVERLRVLNDTGKWDAADELVREVSAILRRKTRADDRLGRFDGSRFVLLLRRVDAELASLIVTQIMSQLRSCLPCDAGSGVPVTVRCGVVGSGVDNPDLGRLLSGALAQCRRAREEGVQIACDLRAEPALSGAST